MPAFQDMTREEQVRFFFSRLPHGVALGVELIEAGQGRILTRVPFSEFMVGNPVTGYVHGGVITALVDQTAGTAAMFASDPPETVATLDLRIDHLTVARAGQPVHAFAECYKATRHICFVRCIAYAEDRNHPIATSMGCFMKTGQLLAGGGERK